MSKIIRVVVPIVFAVIGTVIGGPLGGSIGSLIGTIAVTLIIPPSKGKPRAAVGTSLQIGEVPRQAIVGRAATAGSLVDAFNYGGKYGTDWEVMVIELADHLCDALEGFYVNDAYVAFGADGNVAGYNNQLAVYWRSGTETQTVPTILTTNGPGWTANDNGAGVAYVVVSYKADASDAKNPIWTNGRPKFLWVLRGARCYDPRKDSTAGGVGSHRWLTPTTWEWTDNPIVTRYAFARGFFACDRVTQPEQLVVGRGLSAVEAPPENVFARANLCDELVDGEKRYRAGGTIIANETFIEVENDFAAACAGTISQPEGAVEIDPGEARAAVVTITDKDLVVGSKVKRRWFLGEGDRGWVNTVVPSYIEPAHKWSAHAAPVRRDVADVIADRGSREETVSLGFVTWIKQAGRVGEIVRRLGRLQIRAELVLPPRFCELEEGDWIIWQSDRYLGGAAYTFRVDGWTSDKAWHHSVQLRQISASCYSDVAPLTSGSVAVNQAIPPAIGAPSDLNWTLAAGHIDGGAVRSPVLILAGGNVDPASAFMRVEYVQGAAAPTGATIWNDVGVMGADLRRVEIPAAAGGIYRVAISFVVGGVQGDRLILGPVTAPALTYPDGTPVEDVQRDVTALQRGSSDLHNANADFATGLQDPFLGYSTQTITMLPRADGSGYLCRLSVAASVVGGLYFPNYAVAVPRGYRKMVVEFTPQSTIQASDWVVRLDQAGHGIVLNASLSTLTPNGETGPVAYLTSGRIYRYEVFVLITAATTDVTMFFYCFGSYGGVIDITDLGWRPAEQTETDFLTLRPAEAGATAGAVLGGNLLATPGGAVIPAVQLQNASIVVNADGTVSYNNGTGPINLGAVTISGLGFVGDLDATYGAETDANGVLIGSGGVEVDNNLIVTLQSPAGRVFTANHVPVLDAGQLPATFRFKLFRGAVDVSTTTTWAIVAQTGVTGGIVTIADGVATIPSGCFIATSASITVSATRSGITRTGTVSLSRSDAPAPPSPPGGGTTNGDSTLNSVTGTTLVAISDEIEFSTGASGVATFSGALSLIAAAAANDGTFGAVLRWKIKPTGGSYSDVGASNINDDYPALVTYDSELGGGIYFAETGAINAGASKTGLATGTVHFAQLWGARDDATIAKTVSFGGSVSVTGT